MTLKPTTPAETARLQEIAAGTGVFYPHEIETLGEVLADYHNGTAEDYGHVARTLWDGNTAIGFLYAAPVEMTDRTWELWWIAVAKERQGEGWGGHLLQAAEEIVREEAGRLLLIETSSLPAYAATRGFYEKYGYRWVAQLPDYYRDGDDKVIFAKKVERTSC
jgi:ribosomal protein S18 acetylase RimI-like enzyme